MTIRPAEPGELIHEPTCEAGESKFVADYDGEVLGWVAISRIETTSGEQLWLHDIAHNGPDPMGLVRLMLRARKQAREWGFDEFYTNVTLDSPLAGVWLDHGFELAQLILKGKTHGN